MLVRDQQTLDFPKQPGWPKAGPGRPRSPNAKVLHRSRGCINHREPLHVTMRVNKDVPNLRTGRFIRAFRQTLAFCSARAGFRVVHYSVQSNHVHCLIEADNADTLGRGMKSFGSRFAKVVNRVFGRSGKVLDGRYHLRRLKTPKEVRNALAYVLLNARKHYFQRNRRTPAAAKVDTLSSGVWFDGWKDVVPDPPDRFREVAAPRTWLLTSGWRRHHLIRVDELPGCGKV